MFTKCATCHRWAECPFCGTCHHCRPDVRDACVAARAIRDAQNLQQPGHIARKRESTPYAPGMGQNGTKPRASSPMGNWYAPVRTAELKPNEVKTVRPGRATRSPRKPLTGDARRRALYG